MVLQGVLEKVVLFIVLALVLWGANELRKFYKSAFKELEEVIHFIEDNVAHKPLLQVFPLLEERLKNSKHSPLAAAWREFDASLVKTTHTISTTMRAEVYFNDHSLVDGPLRADLLRNIPGILTGLGIVGTFLGVITGLYGYNSQDLASVRNSISHLLESVQGAFVVSFFAVLSAISFTGAEKIVTSKLYVLVARFQQSLGRVFSQSVSDEYLQRMVEQLEEQGSALRSFSHDLSETIKLSLEELVENQNTTLRESNLKFAETVKQALIEELSPTMRGLTEVMKTVKQTQSDAGQTIIQQMVADFKETLDGASSRQMQAVTGALEGTTSLLTGVHQGMDSLIGSLREEGRQQQASVAQQLEALNMQGLRQQEELESRMAAFASRLEEQSQQWQEKLGQQQDQTIISIKNGMEPLIQTMGIAGKEMLGKMEAAADLLHKEREFLEHSLLRSKEILEKHQQIIAESHVAGRSWNESAAVFQEAGQQIRQVCGQFDEGQKVLDKTVSMFQMQLQQASEQTRIQQSMVQEYQDFSSKLHNDWSGQRQVLEEMDARINQDLKTFVETSSKALQGYLAQVDVNLEKIIQSMRALVEPLTESVEELSEVLEQQSKQYHHSGRR